MEGSGRVWLQSLETILRPECLDDDDADLAPSAKVSEVSP
jgi:hypothetical protein